jgi:hypothetical protein
MRDSVLRVLSPCTGRLQSALGGRGLVGRQARPCKWARSALCDNRGVSHDPASSKILQAVDDVDWHGYSMPPSEQWYRADNVPAAFRLLVASSSQEEGQNAYNGMLSAIGNNHAGCLYPAAVPAVPLLTRVARELLGWPRWSALEILIECLIFSVDREEFVDPSGSTIRTKDAIVTAVRSTREDLQRLAQEQVAFPPAKSAQDLLEQLDEEPWVAE